MKGFVVSVIITKPSQLLKESVDPPTVDRLDSSAVVIRELKVFGFKPLVERGHDGGGIVGVLQTQSMTQLMHGYQENIITSREKKDRMV